MITAEQLKEAKDRVEALNRYLDIDAKKIQLEEEQLRTQAPGFWDDAKKAEEQMKKVKSLEKWIEGYKEVKTLVDELELAFDFYKEEMVTEQEVDEAYAKTIETVEALELKNMLRQEEDPMSCVLKINSGAGGTESQDWASMLMRMYMRYAEAQGYKVTISNLQDGDEAGIKTVTMEVEGDYAYGYLKSENGVHRLVRVSPYNAQGKRMTSFASVFVTPLVDDTIEVYVDPSKISWDLFRSGAPADRMSTRWKRVCACATNIKTQTRERKKKSSSKIRKAESSSKTAKTPCDSSAHNSMTAPSKNEKRHRPRLKRERKKLNGEAKSEATCLTTAA